MPAGPALAIPRLRSSFLAFLRWFPAVPSLLSPPMPVMPVSESQRVPLAEMLKAIQRNRASGNTGPCATERAVERMRQDYRDHTGRVVASAYYNETITTELSTTVPVLFELFQDNGNPWPVSYLAQVDMQAFAAAALPAPLSCTLFWRKDGLTVADAGRLAERMTATWEGFPVRSRVTVAGVGAMEVVFSLPETGAIPFRPYDGYMFDLKKGNAGSLTSTDCGVASLITGYVTGCFASAEDFRLTPREELYRKLMKPTARRRLSL
jgi:hypothetical protein